MELRALREAAKMTQLELAHLLGYSRPRVVGAEKGDGCALLFWQGCDKILNAEGRLVAGFQQIEEIRRREAEEAADIARAQRESRARERQNNTPELLSAESPLASFTVRSHKFIAAYIGNEAVTRIISQGNASPPTQSQWLDCHSIKVGHSSGQCDLYLWPFGVAIFHLVEELNMPNIASLALWRVRSYDENLAWATARLRQQLKSDTVSASYVLSAYWVTEPGWSGNRLDTALRIICTPRVLLQREPGQVDGEQSQAEQVERKLLASGVNHGEMAAFGLSEVSIGYASWSGVVYHPQSPGQSLTEQDLVCCELATQAVWAYCEYINRQAEEGHDPVVPEEYGWRFLRGVRSRLTNPRPQETGQHRSMRDAVIETSGLITHLDQARDILYQIHGR